MPDKPREYLWKFIRFKSSWMECIIFEKWSFSFSHFLLRKKEKKKLKSRDNLISVWHWDVGCHLHETIFLFPQAPPPSTRQNILIYYDPLARNLHHKFSSINFTLIIVWLPPFFLYFHIAKSSGEEGKGNNFFSVNPNNLILVKPPRFPRCSLPHFFYSSFIVKVDSFHLLISHVLIDSIEKKSWFHSCSIWLERKEGSWREKGIIKTFLPPLFTMTLTVDRKKYLSTEAEASFYKYFKENRFWPKNPCQN